MAPLRRSFRGIAATIRFLMACIRYLRRRRMTAQRRPQLRLDFIHPPYWGAEKLDFAISNTGGGGAQNCRYCRLQEFTMAGPEGHSPSFSARRWYSSACLNVPAGGQKRGSASLTLSPCPQTVVGDAVAGNGEESAYQDAIVCQDSAGIVYRFHCFRGPDAAPDMWSAGIFDRVRGVRPPSWAEWAAGSGTVEQARWSDVT